MTGFTTRTDEHGITRNVRKVYRRTREEIGSLATKKEVSESDTININRAKSIFIADLCNTHAWPSTTHKNSMVNEVIQQANAQARRDGRFPTDFSALDISKVSQSVVSQPLLTQYYLR